jgi:type I site-specific restriction endonuclease
MVNLTFPELSETKGQTLPPAHKDTLVQLREEMCSQSASRDFKLQNYQRFLRRVLSPDSPVRCLLMVHGTGTGKTCTAIQIAEEC